MCDQWGPAHTCLQAALHLPAHQVVVVWSGGHFPIILEVAVLMSDSSTFFIRFKIFVLL